MQRVGRHRELMLAMASANISLRAPESGLGTVEKLV